MIAVRADLVQHYIEDHYWDVVSFLMCKHGVGGGERWQAWRAIITHMNQHGTGLNLAAPATSP